MKGFTISGPHGPIVSVGHTTGELFSRVAALNRISLPATDKCAGCGYRKVDKSKLTAFFTEVGKLASSAVHEVQARVFKETVSAVLEALAQEQAGALELIDDYVWCEVHGRL